MKASLENCREKSYIEVRDIRSCQTILTAINLLIEIERCYRLNKRDLHIKDQYR